MDIKIIGGNKNATITYKERREGEIIYIDFSLTLPTPEIPEKTTLRFSFPNFSAYSFFDSTYFLVSRNLRPNWSPKKTEARLAAGIPLQGYVSADGKNDFTLAISDVMTPTEITSGCYEGSKGEVAGEFDLRVSFFTLPIAALESYSATIRIDTRRIPFYDALYDITEWWEKDCGYTPAFVPEAAKNAVNSLWYSYHQEIKLDKILEECRIQKEWGLDTVILDDGWQTEDENRGYAYCGDWEVAPSKIPDMKAFADELHKLGMKFMLWFSVPYVGIHSKAYEKFKTMVLDFEPGKWFCLDPRYKEVRDYLCEIYVNAAQNWGLDGFKLDFIDSFVLQGKSLEPDDRRDYTSLEDAVDALLSEVYEKLTAINPDMLLEFRQNYIGPAVRKYGNMLRVGDCPCDALKNRYDIINLRLTSGKTPIHSDMIMWDYKQPAEYAALQISNVLFGVPQVSVRANELKPDHVEMLKFYLSFWKEHRDILLDGKLIPHNPEAMYSIVSSELSGKAVFALYTDNIVCGEYSYLAVVNSSRKDHFYLENSVGKGYKTYNCQGELLDSGNITERMQKIALPLSGIAIVE